jgi:AraC-like DNA-binding protein
MEFRRQLKTLDNIELLSVQQQVADFPEHFHDTFCISLIRNGTEIIKSENSKLYTSSGSISISNPFEIHANPIFDKDVKIGFDTIYLSQPLVDCLLCSNNIKFENVQSSSSQQVLLFNDLIYSIEKKLNTEIEIVLKKFLLTLQLKTNVNHEYRFNHSNQFLDVLGYIDLNYNNKIRLEKLAEIAYMDKFHFSKAFRIATGMAPINYVQMKKIFYAKNMIRKDSILTQIAYELDFTDQSHFNRTFKQFIGISPSAFQANL